MSVPLNTKICLMIGFQHYKLTIKVFGAKSFSLLSQGSKQQPLGGMKLTSNGPMLHSKRTGLFVIVCLRNNCYCSLWNQLSLQCWPKLETNIESLRYQNMFDRMSSIFIANIIVIYPQMVILLLVQLCVIYRHVGVVPEIKVVKINKVNFADYPQRDWPLVVHSIADILMVVV